MNQNFILKKGSSVHSPSTLLIPDFLLFYFNQKKKQFGNLKAMFHYVVNHKHRVYSAKSKSQEAKTRYQSGGLQLHRKVFFPNLEDWEKFRIYANLQRVSMTLLFVMVLLAWKNFEEDDIGVPRAPRTIQLIHCLIISKSYTYLLIHHLVL